MILATSGCHGIPKTLSTCNAVGAFANDTPRAARSLHAIRLGRALFLATFEWSDAIQSDKPALEQVLERAGRDRLPKPAREAAKVSRDPKGEQRIFQWLHVRRT